MQMSEIVFVVQPAPDGGYTARDLGECIFTETVTAAQLRQVVQDAVHCLYDEGRSPKSNQLHFVLDELLAAQTRAQFFN